MTEREIIIPHSGEFYQDEKGNLFQIVTVAQHYETGQNMAIYQDLKRTYQIFARPAEHFVSKTEKRFTRVQLQAQNTDSIEKRIELEKETEEQKKQTSSTLKEQKIEGIDPDFLLFLDTDSYKEKLEVFQKLKSKMNEKLLADLAVSLDLVIEDASMEEGMARITAYLETRKKFETSRLR